MEKAAENISETLAYKKYCLLIETMECPPKSFLKMSSKDLDALCHHLNENVFARLQLIKLAVLPRLRRYEAKITSTSHLLMQCFKNAFGASGTLSLQNIPHAFHVQNDEKAMAGTLISLLKKDARKNNPPITEVSEKESVKIVQELPKINSNTSVLIEIGAALRDYPRLLDIAHDIFKVFPQYDAVATFDEKGAPIILKKGEKLFLAKDLLKIDPNKVFWVFAQKDITGTDEKLPSLAEAVVFVNEHTTLTELVQGIGRMRGIHNGQNAQLCLDKDSALLIKKTLGKKSQDSLYLLDMCEYCARREAHMNVNFQSLALQWNALLEKPFWEQALRSSGCSSAVARDFAQLKALFVESTKDNPTARPSFSQTTMPIEDALQLLSDKYCDKIKTVKSKLSKTGLSHHYSKKTLLKQMKKVQEKMVYPPQVLYQNDAQKTQITMASVEQQSVANADVELFEDSQEKQTGVQDTDVTTESTQVLSTWASNNRLREWLPHNKASPMHSLERVFSHPQLQEYRELFSDVDLAISENCFVTLLGDSIDQPGWINGYVKPLHYIFLPSEGSANLIDESEAAERIKSQAPGTLWLVNHGVIYSTTRKTSQSLWKDPHFNKIELAVKILDGDLSFDQLQMQTFEALIGKAKMKLLMSFVDRILCPLHPGFEKTSEYAQLLKQDGPNWQ